MTSYSNHIRPLLLLRLLSSSGTAWTLSELSEELEVSQKTVRRDIAHLQDAGFPIEQSVGPHGRKSWTCHLDKMLSQLTLTFEEAVALYLGRQFLEPMAGTIFFTAANTAFRKIRAILTRETREYLEQFTALFHQTRLGESNYSQRGEIIDTLMIAIEDRNVTQLLYSSMSAESPKEVVLHPFGLAYHRGSLYIVAFVPEYDELRHYKVDRIHDIGILKKKFDKRMEFSLPEHLSSTFGIFQNEGKPYLIRVRFAAEVARYVQEQHWHASQNLTPQPGGTLLLELQLTALEEFKSWVLSFGAKAVVEEPEALREMVLQDLQKSLENYDAESANQLRG